MDTDWRTAVRDAVAIMDDEPTVHDDEIVERLKARGYTHDEANLLALMVPLAYGRIVIADIGTVAVSKNFFAQGKHEKWVSRVLTDQPVYQEAWQVAHATRHRAAGDLLRIAARSSELKAIVDSVEDGEKPKGHCLPPYITLPASLFEDRPWWKLW